MVRRAQAFATCLLLGLPAHAAIVRAQPAITDVEVTTPRSFGYVIGDTIEHRVSLELGGDHRLENASLPRKGRMNRWLELRAPAVRQYTQGSGTHYEIVLVYQIFNVGDRLQQVTVPGVELSVAGPHRSLPVFIPEWTFTLAPLGTGLRSEAAGLTRLRPDRPPPLLPVAPHVDRLVELSAVLLAALLYLGYARWGIPFLARRRWPFAVALRRLAKLEKQRFDEAHYRVALRCVHEAFNRTSGRVLFLDDLDGFFLTNPQFAPQRGSIEALFRRSREVFFGGEAPSGDGTDGLERLARLCSQCRDLERGTA